MSRELRNRVIVITGASAGIGEAAAIACAKAGMHVVVSARRKNKLDALVQQIEQLGGVATSVACDVRRDDEVPRLFEQAHSRFGRLDAVFANAGFGVFSSIADTPDALVRELFETNFFGTLRCIRSALPYLRRRTNHDWRQIIICASAVSEIGLPMYGHYAATKSAQDALASALRAELSDERIDVASVHPIGSTTRFFDVVQQVSPTGNGPVGLNTPARLMQSPETVARAVVRCLRRPKPEVWPGVAGVGVRLGLALTVAFPRLGAAAMRGMMRKQCKNKPPAPPLNEPTNS